MSNDPTTGYIIPWEDDEAFVCQDCGDRYFGADEQGAPTTTSVGVRCAECEEIPIGNEYNVKFTGDYFSMTVCVQNVDFPADEYDDEVVIDLASNIIKEQYGWDVLKASTIDIEVEPA